jgi:hypothetical protein
MSVAAKSSPVHNTGCPVLSASAYVNGHHVHLCVTKEPVDHVLPGRPQPSLNDDAQLDAYGGRHQPDEGILKVGRNLVATRLAGDDRHGSRTSRRVDWLRHWLFPRSADGG